MPLTGKFHNYPVDEQALFEKQMERPKTLTSSNKINLKKKIRGSSRAEGSGLLLVVMSYFFYRPRNPNLRVFFQANVCFR